MTKDMYADNLESNVSDLIDRLHLMAYTVCVNSASTVLGGAGDNDESKAKWDSRSSRVRRGVNKRLAMDVLL